MKKIVFILITIFICYVSNSTAQLPNKNMYLLSKIDSHGKPYSAVWGYVAPDGREYAILGSYDGTSFIDITDVANIHEVDFVPSTNLLSSNNSWREMKTYSHYAYIVSEVGNSGVQIVDLQYLPDSVRYVKKFLAPAHNTTHSISQSGPYLYLNGSNSTFGQGVRILDLTVDPETPVRRGAYNFDYIHDCRVVNDTIYAANIYSSRVSIISAINKDSLKFVTSFINFPNSGPHNTAVTPDRKYILVTDEIGASPMLLKFWNIENLSNITYVSSWQPTGITTSIVHNVEVYGNYALVGHYSAGVRFIDITNPSIPTEVAWYDTYPLNNNSNYNGCWGAYMFPSGKIVASDRQTGLYVLKTTFNISVAIQGLYNENTNMLNVRDSVTAYLRNSVAPYSIVDSSKIVIDSISLTGNFQFNLAPSGNYYIALKHRNSIETWSNIPIDYNPMTFETYNFTTSDSMAYLNNMTNVDSLPVVFAMYSGDVNQDGIIDAGDLSLIDNDVVNSISGYVSTDLNGDYFVDASDASIADNNAFRAIIKRTPKQK